jgi:CheY-like chemotaxis protein
VDGDDMLGLAMLGVRPERTWVTRMGVLPNRRRRGVGEAILLYLLAASERLGIELVTLEVIKGNVPAYQLFLKWGFHETRDLIILRRPPGPPTRVPKGDLRWLDKAEAIELAQMRQFPLTWINDTPSLSNADHVIGLTVTLPDDSHGWVVFQKHKFYLTRLTIETVRGDPVAVGEALFACMYQRFPDMDTNIENVSTINRHLPAFFNAGFVEAFRRVEMYRVANPALSRVARIVRGDTTVRRIMIVDDEESVAFTLGEGLKTLSDCEITVVTSGEQAWRYFEEQVFDLLVTDYKLPDMDGMTLARRVRRLYPRTSIVMITAYGDDALREQASRVAIHRVLDKPVGIKEIRSVASEALEETENGQTSG